MKKNDIAQSIYDEMEKRYPVGIPSYIQAQIETLLMWLEVERQAEAKIKKEGLFESPDAYKIFKESVNAIRLITTQLLLSPNSIDKAHKSQDNSDMKAVAELLMS